MAKTGWSVRHKHQFFPQRIYLHTTTWKFKYYSARQDCERKSATCTKGLNCSIKIHNAWGIQKVDVLEMLMSTGASGSRLRCAVSLKPCALECVKSAHDFKRVSCATFCIFRSFLQFQPAQSHLVPIYGVVLPFVTLDKVISESFCYLSLGDRPKIMCTVHILQAHDES